MPYISSLQVIRRGDKNRQFYMICPAPLAAALDMEKGEQLEWVVVDRYTFQIRRAKPASRTHKGSHE